MKDFKIKIINRTGSKNKGVLQVIKDLNRFTEIVIDALKDQSPAAYAKAIKDTEFKLILGEKHLDTIHRLQNIYTQSKDYNRLAI